MHYLAAIKAVMVSRRTVCSRDFLHSTSMRIVLSINHRGNTAVVLAVA